MCSMSRIHGVPTRSPGSVTIGGRIKELYYGAERGEEIMDVATWKIDGKRRENARSADENEEEKGRFK